MNHDFGDALDLFDLVSDRKGTQLRHGWSSPEALARFVSSIDARTNWSNSAWDNDVHRGTRSMSAALDMAERGWQEGAERAVALLDKIKAENPVGPRMVRWDVAGAYPSVARALSGNPMSMRRTDTTRLHRRPVVTLLSNMSIHWGVDAAVIARRAVVVTAIVDRIEDAGFSCEVVGFAGSGETMLDWQVMTRLKESNQPADLARLSFGLGHPAMFRRLAFACVESCGHMSPLGRGLGSPHELAKSDAPGTYVLPELRETHFSSDVAASTVGLASMIASLVKQECPAFAGANQ